MDKFCMNCGEPLEEDAVFCGNCGMKLNDDSQKQRVQTPPKQTVQIPPKQSLQKPSPTKKKPPLPYLIVIVIVIGLITAGAMFAKNKFFGKEEATVYETTKVSTKQMEKKGESVSESNSLLSESTMPSETKIDESSVDTTTKVDEGFKTDGIDGIVDAKSFTIEEISGFWSGILTEYISEEEFMEVDLELVFTPSSSNKGTMTFYSQGGSYVDGDIISPSEQISMDYFYSDGQLRFEIPEVGFVFEIIFFEDEGLVYGYGYTNEIDQGYYQIVLYR